MLLTEYWIICSQRSTGTQRLYWTSFEKMWRSNSSKSCDIHDWRSGPESGMQTSATCLFVLYF